jgi:hypothetical protein
MLMKVEENVLLPEDGQSIDQTRRKCIVYLHDLSTQQQLLPVEDELVLVLVIVRPACKMWRTDD